MRMESPLNQRLRRSPPDHVYTPIDVTSDPPFRNTKPARKVVTGHHRVVRDKVERLLLRWTDAEGRCRLHHPLGTGHRCPLPLRRLSAQLSARAGAGDHALQREEPAADHPRGATPEAKVPSFQRVPGLHGDEAFTEVPFLAEPRRQPLLPHAGRQDQDGVGAASVVVFRYGPQPVVE